MTDMDLLMKLHRASKRCRELQRKYFATRDRRDLIASKSAERDLDELLRHPGCVALEPANVLPEETREFEPIPIDEAEQFPVETWERLKATKVLR